MIQIPFFTPLHMLQRLFCFISVETVCLLLELYYSIVLTGQYLQEKNLRDIIEFCQRNKLLILADEVYQENMWNKNFRFSSLRKVLLEMGPEYSDVQLVSFNSTSKGYFGE